MKRILESCFWIGILFSHFAWGRESLYQLVYLEHRDGIEKKIIQKEGGLVEPFSFLENFPRGLLEKEILSSEEIQISGATFQKSQFRLQMKADIEVIPLTEQEKKINQQLHPFQIESVHLEGEGELWVRSSNDQLLAEKGALVGNFQRQGERKEIKIEWARGLLWSTY